jgi:ketosteroid isomerase-like protein
MTNADTWIAIYSALVRYASCLDAGDIEGVAACFSEHGVVQSHTRGRFEGRDGIRAFARLVDSVPGQLRHAITNVSISVSDQAARVSCYLLAFATRDGSSELVSPGTYQFQLVYEDDSWLIQTYGSSLDSDPKVV